MLPFTLSRGERNEPVEDRPLARRSQPSQGRTRKPPRPKAPDFVAQFCIELLGIDPPVWRRIQVPSDYTFWDLHVAIQDAMGWFDRHLHAYRIAGHHQVIGVPDDYRVGHSETAPGWEVSIDTIFSEDRPLALYEYDFGDSWVHKVRFEAHLPAEKGVKFPRCLDGVRRCPPEDCGGPIGYEEFLRIIGDETDAEHADMVEWTGGTFDPEDFDPAAVEFDDPAERFRGALGEEE